MQEEGRGKGGRGPPHTWLSGTCMREWSSFNLMVEPADAERRCHQAWINAVAPSQRQVAAAALATGSHTTVCAARKGLITGVRDLMLRMLPFDMRNALVDAAQLPMLEGCGYRQQPPIKLCRQSERGCMMHSLRTRPRGRKHDLRLAGPDHPVVEGVSKGASSSVRICPRSSSTICRELQGRLQNAATMDDSEDSKLVLSCCRLRSAQGKAALKH